MNKKTNKDFYDDGHTVYNMDVDGMPHRNFKNKSDIILTKKERKAMIMAAITHYIPIVIGVIMCFLVTMIILYFWLVK